MKKRIIISLVAFLLALVPMILCHVVVAMRGDIDIYVIGDGKIEYTKNDGYYVEINSKKYHISTYINTLGPYRDHIEPKHIGWHVSVFTTSKLEGNQSIFWSFVDQEDYIFVERQLKRWTFELFSFNRAEWALCWFALVMFVHLFVQLKLRYK